VLAYEPTSGAAKASIEDALEGLDLSGYAELATVPSGGGGGAGAGAAAGGDAHPADAGDDAFADVVGDGGADLGF
jgi:hypothetical protein